MDALGRHELVEIYGCDFRVLDDEEAIRRHMMAAAIAARATVVGERFHKFGPQGVSGVVLLAESHLSIHTWPEHGYAAVDLFTCSAVDGEACVRLLVAALAGRHHKSSVISRGVHEEIARVAAADPSTRAVPGRLGQ